MQKPRTKPQKDCIEYLQTRFWMTFINPGKKGMTALAKDVYQQLEKRAGNYEEPDVDWKSYNSLKRAPRPSTRNAVDKCFPGSADIFTFGPGRVIETLQSHSLGSTYWPGSDPTDNKLNAQPAKHDKALIFWPGPWHSPIEEAVYLGLRKYMIWSFFEQLDEAMGQAGINMGDTGLFAFDDARNYLSWLQKAVTVLVDMGDQFLAYALRAALMEHKFYQSEASLLKIFTKCVRYFRDQWRVEPELWIVNEELVRIRADLVADNFDDASNLWPKTKSALDNLPIHFAEIEEFNAEVIKRGVKITDAIGAMPENVKFSFFHLSSHYRNEKKEAERDRAALKKRKRVDEDELK